MNDHPQDLKYSKEHEWIKLGENGIGEVGITHFAQDSLGDVVFVELPEVGDGVEQFEKMGEIESVKAVSDLYSPISGKIVERNDRLIDSPELVNDRPYDDGWLVRVELADASETDKLLSADEYAAFLDTEG